MNYMKKQLSFLVLVVIAGISVYDVIKETSVENFSAEKKIEKVKTKEKVNTVWVGVTLIFRGKYPGQRFLNLIFSRI